MKVGDKVRIKDSSYIMRFIGSGDITVKRHIDGFIITIGFLNLENLYETYTITNISTNGLCVNVVQKNGASYWFETSEIEPIPEIITKEVSNKDFVEKLKQSVNEFMDAIPDSEKETYKNIFIPNFFKYLSNKV